MYKNNFLVILRITALFMAVYIVLRKFTAQIVFSLLIVVVCFFRFAMQLFGFSSLFCPGFVSNFGVA